MGARLKTINADEAAYEGFRQLAKECKLTSPELVAAMVQYFRVTKADPREPTGPDLTTLLAKLGAKIDGLDKRTIGFIREQEKQYLKPILAEVQAHQVLSSLAPGAPAGLNAAQESELKNWFMRLLLVGMQPNLLLPEALAREPELAAIMKGPTSKDPALEGIKSGLLAAVQVAFQPTYLTDNIRVTTPTQAA